jgi:drug/metabolite transporter (DMT)-like permease
LNQKNQPVDQGRFGWVDGLLVLVVLFWGVNIILVKVALVVLPPLAFNGLRLLLAATLMLILAPALGYSLRFQRRHLLHLIGLGLAGSTAYQLFFIFGADQTSADNTSLILSTVPAWVALIGTLIGTEQVTGRGWLGIIFSLVGIALIVLGSDREVQLHFGRATLWGDLLILAATLAWSIYTLGSRPIFKHYSSIAVTCFAGVAGNLPIAILGAPALLAQDWSTVSLKVWLAVIFSGVFSITLAYFFWNYGVSRLGSARTALYSNLVPPVTLLAAWLWLGETLTLTQALGGVLALIGVFLARRFTYTVVDRASGSTLK